MTTRFALAATACLATAVLAAAACSGKHHHAPAPVTVTQTVGSSGGSVTAPDGASVDVPPGALDSNQTLSITETQQPAPDGYGALSTVYQFGPEGVVFAQPVTVTLPLPSGATAGDLFWSRLGAPGYDDVGGAVSGGAVVGQVVHFSSGFIGTPTGARTINGTDVTTWVTPNGIENVPVDFSTTPVVALVLDTASGSFQTYPGSGSTNGTFTIPGVPYGTYYVRVNGNYTITDLDTIDLGTAKPGRPDAVVASNGSTIEFDLTNLAPWQSGDDLEAFAGGNDDWWFDLVNGCASAVPAVGDMSLSTYDLFVSQDCGGSGHPEHLVEGSKGDRLTLAQLVVTTDGAGHSWTAMTHLYTAPSFDETQGGTDVLSGAFVDESTDQPLPTLDVRASQFSSLLPQVSPVWGGNLLFSGFSVLGYPGGTSYGAYSANADLLTMSLTTDSTVSGASFGEPLTGTWGAVGDARGFWLAPITLSSNLSPTYQYLTLDLEEDLTSMTAGPIVPTLTPVRAPMVSGRDLTTRQDGVGASPVISWQAPATGTPTKYAVQIWHLTSTGSSTGQSRVTALTTTGTSVQVPPGVLVTGEPYYVIIDALQNDVPINQPHRLSFPGAVAPFISGIFTP